jgi:hypothetical protein
MLDRPGPSDPHRGFVVFARVRQALAVLGLAVGAVMLGHRELTMLSTNPHGYVFDPAALFYAVGAVGLALGWFWSRYLVLCLVAAISVIQFAFFASWPSLAGRLAFMALLVGPTMRRLFDEREGRLNHWTAVLDGRVARLRVLFVAQAIAIGLVFAARDVLPAVAVPAVIIGGLALAGLVFQQTWAALVITLVIALEGSVALSMRGLAVRYGADAAMRISAFTLAACAVSLIVLAPLLAAFVRKLRAAPPAS